MKLNTSDAQMPVWKHRIGMKVGVIGIREPNSGAQRGAHVGIIKGREQVRKRKGKITLKRSELKKYKQTGTRHCRD